MARLLFVPLIIGAQLCSVAFCADSQTSATTPVASTVFYKQVPSQVSTKLTETLSRVKGKLSPKAVAAGENARAYVETTDIKHMSPDGVTQGGRAGIPSIGELLVSDNSKLRVKSVIALGMSYADTRSTSPDALDDDALIALFLRRSALDKDPEVRMHAINCMKRFAFARLEAIPEDVSAGLKEALNDPDPKLRQLAADYIDIINAALADMPQMQQNTQSTQQSPSDDD